MVLEPEQSTELLLSENFGSSSPTARREVVEAMGGYDEFFTPSDDFDFTYRVASAHKIAVLPRVGWYKRQHPTNMSSNIPRVLRFKILTRQTILDRERVPRRRRKLERRIATWHFDLAYYYTGRDNGLAWRHAFHCLKLRPWPFGRSLAKLILRLLLDVLGRDTNSSRRWPPRMAEGTAGDSVRR
jgi:GT2 family glycosyltransferase